MLLRFAIASLMLVACVAKDDYPVLPPGGGGSQDPGDPPGDASHVDAFVDAPKALASGYTVSWHTHKLEDPNGELHDLNCTPALCAPITSTTTLAATIDTTGHLDMVFASSPTASTHVVSSTVFAKDERGWFVLVAAKIDSVADMRTRREFQIRQATSGVLSATIVWDVGNPASHVTFDFTATPI